LVFNEAFEILGCYKLLFAHLGGETVLGHFSSTAHAKQPSWFARQVPHGAAVLSRSRWSSWVFVRWDCFLAYPARSLC